MSRLLCSSSRALRLGRIDDRARELVIVEIGKLGTVKDVNADVKYGKGLLCEDKRDKVVAFMDGEKGSGKILMAMLFSEDDGVATSNGSVSWKRELLAENWELELREAAISPTTAVKLQNHWQFLTLLG